jgi:putative protease
MADMEPVIAMRPDALIMSDPGLIMMVREKWPENAGSPLCAGKYR